MRFLIALVLLTLSFTFASFAEDIAVVPHAGLTEFYPGHGPGHGPGYPPGSGYPPGPGYPGPGYPEPVPHTPGYPYYPTPSPVPYPVFPYPQPQPVYVCSARGQSGYFYTGWGVQPQIAQWYANNYCYSNEPYCYFYGCIIR